LRTLSLDGVAAVVRTMPSTIAEIPKDLLDAVSLKELFRALEGCGKTLSMAGTTNFARLSGLSWRDYQKYLDVQVASSRFLRCEIWRVFLQASTTNELRQSIDRLSEYGSRFSDLEVVIETHGGAESTREGFEFCLEQLPYRFVIDLANIPDPALCEAILEGNFHRRIAYFHTRNLGAYVEAEALLPLELKALSAYPDHVFLWEPKNVDGREALRFFQKDAAAIM